MNKITRIHPKKQPRRPHFIKEWAQMRGFDQQTDLAKALDIDKSVVSRWFTGSSPSEPHQESLAQLFHCEREALFRHPDDDWLARFFAGRSREEIEKIKQTVEVAFPRKSA